MLGPGGLAIGRPGGGGGGGPAAARLLNAPAVRSGGGKRAGSRPLWLE